MGCLWGVHGVWGCSWGVGVFVECGGVCGVFMRCLSDCHMFIGYSSGVHGVWVWVFVRFSLSSLARRQVRGYSYIHVFVGFVTMWRHTCVFDHIMMPQIENNIPFHDATYIHSYIYTGLSYTPPTTSLVTPTSTTCLISTSCIYFYWRGASPHPPRLLHAVCPKKERGLCDGQGTEFRAQHCHWAGNHTGASALPWASLGISLVPDGIHGGRQEIIKVGTPPGRFHLLAHEEIYCLHGQHCWGSPHHCKEEAGWFPIQVNSIWHVFYCGILCWAAWAPYCCAVEEDPPRGCSQMPRCVWARFNSSIRFMLILHLPMIQIGLHDMHWLYDADLAWSGVKYYFKLVNVPDGDWQGLADQVAQYLGFMNIEHKSSTHISHVHPHHIPQPPLPEVKSKGERCSKSIRPPHRRCVTISDVLPQISSNLCHWPCSHDWRVSGG